MYLSRKKSKVAELPFPPKKVSFLDIIAAEVDYEPSKKLEEAIWLVGIAVVQWLI